MALTSHRVWIVTAYGRGHTCIVSQISLRRIEYGKVGGVQEEWVLKATSDVIIKENVGNTISLTRIEIDSQTVEHNVDVICWMRW